MKRKSCGQKESELFNSEKKASKTLFPSAVNKKRHKTNAVSKEKHLVLINQVRMVHQDCFFTFEIDVQKVCKATTRSKAGRAQTAAFRSSRETRARMQSHALPRTDPVLEK